MRKTSFINVALVGLLTWLVIAFSPPSFAQERFTEKEIARLVPSEFILGPREKDLPIWQLVDVKNKQIGYIFESRELVNIPGFAGLPINLLVAIDLEGEFIRILVLEQREPVFVAGLGVMPLNNFVRQYKGHSLASNIKVAGPYNKKKKSFSSNIVIDGVTKATASVRIVNETVLASALKVARAKLKGIVPRPAALPKKDLFEKMSWQQLLDAGLVRKLTLKNAQLEKAFAGSYYEDDDPEARANPDDVYLDLWVADLGIPTVAQNLLDKETLEMLPVQVTEFEEPILVLANGRHQLVDEDFVPNSVPDRMGIRQGEFPINVRDADVDVQLKSGFPYFEQAMVLRMDTRVGFDPSSPWVLSLKAIRQHGSFRSEVGHRDFPYEHKPDAKWYEEPPEVDNAPPWLQSWKDRAIDMAFLTLFFLALAWMLFKKQSQLAAKPVLTPVRLIALAITVFFIGWYGQGQLSIVTVLGLATGVAEGRDMSFLLYDPFSLLLWGFVLITLVIWGRGTFCGWLCPFGALQEFTYTLGRWLRLPEWKISADADQKLKWIKYLILAGLVVVAFVSQTWADKLVEVEPFKTTITLAFDRAWPFVLYAGAWLLLGVFMFKGFCRYICPLGATLALFGKTRRWQWIERRSACGTPCRLCTVKCSYGAIDTEGKIDYDECFQCLDCVQIYDDPKQCVPLILETKNGENKDAA
ncbi:MAG: 4Fe-4S binding protein [Rhodospirillales bacterium]|nr:4Fe-4S binding protein [Rhodospirillales bacterium]